MTKKEYWDIIVKIVIAVIVPITVAITGVFGQKIVAEHSANEQALERLVRQKEAETAFRRDLFALLFNDYVDQISATDEPVHLDALTTRLELLSSNFSNFLKLRPLFVQLDRQINHIFGGSSDQIRDNDLLRRNYQKRLELAARAVTEEQVGQIYQHGITMKLSADAETMIETGSIFYWDSYEEDEKWSRDRVVLDGVTHYIELSLSDLNMNQQQARINLKVLAPGPGSDVPLVIINSTFTLDHYSFPLENYSTLRNNYRIALSLDDFDEKTVEFSVHIFRFISGNFEDVRRNI